MITKEEFSNWETRTASTLELMAACKDKIVTLADEIELMKIGLPGKERVIRDNTDFEEKGIKLAKDIENYVKKEMIEANELIAAKKKELKQTEADSDILEKEFRFHMKWADLRQTVCPEKEEIKE